MAFLFGADNLGNDSNGPARIEVTYTQCRHSETLDLRIARGFQMSGSGVVVSIIQPVRHVLNGITVSIQGLLEHAGSRYWLYQFYLRIARVGDMQMADPIPGLPEVSALRVLCGQVVHVHEAADPHGFNEKCLGCRDVFDDPGNLAERWSNYWFSHVWNPEVRMHRCGLTMRLSGRTQTHPALAESQRAKRAGNAPTRGAHGPWILPNTATVRFAGPLLALFSHSLKWTRRQRPRQFHDEGRQVSCNDQPYAGNRVVSGADPGLDVGACHGRWRLDATRIRRATTHYQWLVCDVLGYRSVSTHRVASEEICPRHSFRLRAICGCPAVCCCRACRCRGPTSPAFPFPMYRQMLVSGGVYARACSAPVGRRPQARVSLTLSANLRVPRLACFVQGASERS